MSTAAPALKTKNRIEFDNFYVELKSDGIMYVFVHTEIEFSVSVIKIIVESIGKLGSGKKFPVLIQFDQWTLPCQENRNNLAKSEFNPSGLADAFVLTSLPQVIIGNFFLNFNKPARPSKIFKTEEEAIHWLKTFLPKEKSNDK